MGLGTRRNPCSRGLRAALLVVGLVVGLAGAGCFELPLEEADRGLLVTAEDLGAWGVPIDRGAASVVERRTRYFDGSLAVEYEFDASESSESPLFVTSSVDFEMTEGDARTYFAVLRKSFELTAGWEGMGVNPAPSPYAAGDDSYYAMLDYDGAAVGNLFLARHGKKTFFFVVSGYHIEDPGQFAALVEPRLAYLEGYKP